MPLDLYQSNIARQWAAMKERDGAGARCARSGDSHGWPGAPDRPFGDPSWGGTARTALGGDLDGQPTDTAVPIDATGLPVPEILADQTLRMMVTPHLAGSVLRDPFLCRFGKEATTFGHVTVGIAATNAVSDVTPVTFGRTKQ